MKGIVTAVIVSCCAAAFAVVPAKADDTVQLKEVVVTATKTEKEPQDVTQSVTVITSDEIQRSGAQTAAEAIDHASGIKLTETGGKGSVTEINIRGANSEQVVVLLDGRRLNSASAGGFDMSSLPVPLEDIERIEIVRGAASSLYGADALGGVVNIITKKPRGPSTTVKAEAGTHGWQDLTVGNSNKIDKFYYSLSGGTQKYDGFRVNSDLDQWKAAIKLGYDHSADTNVELSIDSLGKEIGVPGSTADGGIFLSPLAREWDRTQGSSLTYKTKFTRELDLRLNVYQNQDDIRFIDPNPFFRQHTENTSTSTGAEVQTNWVANSWNLLTLGAEARQNHLDGINTEQPDASPGVHTDSIMAAYIQDEISAGESLIVVVGAREDTNSVYGSNLSPKVSARYIISPTGTIIRASAGEAFRGPTLNELFWQFDGFEQGNPALQPETSKEYEAGIEQPFGKRYSVKFTYFRRLVDNLINWQVDPSTFIYSPVNISRARIEGSESEVKIAPFESFTWALNYTYTKAVTDQLTSSYIAGIPAAQAKSYVNVTLPGKTNLFIDGRYVRNYTYPGIPNPTQEYTVADAKLSQPVELGQKVKAEIYAGVKNMFNREYQVNAGYPMPGREWFGGVSLVF
ncbi:MAG TPA: TonB-dependent receptor [Nitrospirota bacterium]|nr:TonB-dependent receptor [Nitrospirota bacterium]